MWKTLSKLITKYYLQNQKCNIYWRYKGKDKRMNILTPKQAKRLETAINWVLKLQHE